MAWAHTNGKGAVSTSTAAFTNPLTPGSLIVVWIFNAAIAVWTVTDTAGNSYVDCGAGSVVWQSSTFQIQVFYAINTKSTASNVVTMNFQSGSQSVNVIIADEFTGNAQSSPVDVFASQANGVGNGAGTNNVTTPALRPSSDGDLIYAAFGCAAGTLSAGTGFTAGETGSGGELSEYLFQGAHASVTPAATDNNNAENYGGISVAFKPLEVVIERIQYQLGIN